MTARAQILDALEKLASAPGAVEVPGAVPAPPLMSSMHDLGAVELQKYFLEQCERSRATVSIVECRTAIPDAIRAFLSGQALGEQLLVGETLEDLDWSNLTCLDETPERIMADGLSVVTEAQYAVAETGSIVAVSGPACDARLNFLAETHIAVLSMGTIVATAEDVWALLRGDRAAPDMPRAVNFITGPSRTADIEQTIELGAHGPRRLHVILVED